MADPLSPPAEDPFAQIIGGSDPMSQPPPRAATLAVNLGPAVVQQDNDPFAEFDAVGPSPVSATGAFARGVEKSALPAIGSLPAIGVGAEAGAAAGLPLAPFTGGWSIPAGAVLGGIAGGIGGSYAISEVQNWAVKKLPDSWRDKLGLDDRSARLDEAQHPTASFMGGLVPLAVTMNPTAAARDLPANATALQQIMAHPVTSRMFGGGVMGGMEVGNEKLHGGDIDWRKTAIATTFGMIMNRPNRVGERLIDVGAHPARVVMGHPEPVSAATVAQAADAKVMGPGVTEGVFRGTEEQAPAAAQTAQENARIERDAIGEPPTPDLHGIARQMEPDLFAKYDELLKRRETFEAWHGEGPGHEMAEKHLAATNAEIAEMGPTVAAAYRRAADTVGTGTIEAEQFQSFVAMLAAHESGRGNVPRETQAMPQEGTSNVPEGHSSPQEVPISGSQAPTEPLNAPATVAPPRAIGDQRAFIADDVSKKLIAAGRPPEEAAAAGKIIAARYITRAGRFEGKLGTAEELYAREGAAIAGPNERPQVPAGASAAPAPPAVAKRGRAHPTALQTDPRIAESFEAFHGSPHRLDRFDVSNIGIGEGNQSYGHGLYFAENINAAVHYRLTVSDKEFIRKTSELYGELDHPDDALAAIAGSKNFRPDEKRLLTALEKDHWLGFEYPHQAVEAALREPEHFDLSPETIQAVRDLGYMYKVRVRANLDHFLDWDKPIGEQSEHIRKALLEHPDPEIAGTAAKQGSFSGGDFYSRLASREATAYPYDDAALADRPAKTARRLSEAGIPGIKYLDQGSRSAGGGSRNFVVFDDKHVEIINRNGESVVKPFAESLAGNPDLITKPKPRGRAAAHPDTLSLNEHLASQGGLRPDSELEAIYGGDRGPFVPGFGPLIRKTGMTLDEALSSAKQHGYMFDPHDADNGSAGVAGRTSHGLTPNDLLDHLDAENRGRKLYKAGHLEATKYDAEQEKHVVFGHVEAEFEAAGLKASDIDGKLLDRTVEIVRREGERDVLAAYERAIMEDHDSYEGLRNDRQSTEPIAGWDAHDARAASGRGEANIGERREAGLPEQEASAGHGGEPRDDGARNREAALAQSVDEYFQRVYYGNHQPEFELGADGKPQQLIPGIAPVSQRDLIQAAANKPMRGGNAPPPEGGLFGDTANQKELFQRRDTSDIDWTPGGGSKTTVIGSTTVEYGISRDGKSGEIILIKTPPSAQGEGSARAAMETIVQKADENSTTLFLNSQPMGKGISKNQLDKFYRSLGFVRNSGRNKDFTSRAEFVRQPEKEFDQTARGKIRIAEGRRPVITLMKDANPSTFIHESGHQFLEELMHDAVHPDAPMQLRDDAQTVRDWLGVTDDIKTKHHEKFARGFEQYVREGVAPSPELAGVFAKFRNWLMSIYQSIKGLGTEISPEIRGVFDRMLEMEPQRTVVMPERVSPTLLHDIHEAEAQHIEPHEAEGAMDRIVAERDRYIAEQPPEIQRELETAAVKVQQAQAATGGAAAAEGGASAGGPSEVVGDRSGPVAELSGGAGGTEPRTVKPGGSGTGTESADVQRLDLRSKLGDHAGTALAPGPTDLFGARESPFTDRAGNIRLDTLNTVEDVKQALRDSAAENNDFIGDRRGVVTDGQVLELANDIGMSGAENLVKKHVTGQAYNAEQVVALRKLLRESAASVSVAAKKAATSGLDEDVLAYAQAKDRLQMVQKTVAGVTAEAGRALRAFRTLPGEADTAALEQMIKEATGKTLFQLKQEAKLASAIDTPQSMNKFMQDVDRHSAGAMLLEGWINGLLSGPATQITNIMGNAVFAIQHFGPEKVIAGLIGSAAHAVGREGAYTRVGETVAAARGLKEGAAPALGATGEAFWRGASTLLPGEEGPASGILEGIVHDDMIPRGTLDEATTMRDVGAGLFSIVRGIPDAIMTAGALLRAGGVEGSPLWNTKYAIQGAIPDIQVRGMNVLPIGTAIRLPGRFLATMDTFFRSLNYSMAKNGIAYRMASDEGLAGVEFAQRVAEIRDNPSPEVMEQARGTATETTFMDKGGEFVRAINYLTSREANLPLLGPIKPLKFVAPFTNVVSRILEQTIVKRTPLGIFSQELRNDLIGKNGNVAQDTAAARMLLGSALMLGFGSLASQKYITGSGPKDPKENAIWRTVYQPHSVRIGDMYYQIQKLGPMGMLMGLAADLHDMGHLIAEDKYAEAGGFLLHAIVQNVLDQSAMQGPAEIIKAIEDPDRYGPQYIKSFLSSFVPNSIGSYARAHDPYIRQTWGIVDALKQKLPGYSEELHPKIDIWGEPVPHREALGGAGVTGVYVQRMNADPVNRAMIDLGIHPGAVEKKIRNIELTPQQYEDFARIAGRMTKQRLDVIVNSSQFQTLPPYQRALILTNTFKESRAAASGMVKMKNPQIVNDATQALLKKINKK